MAEGVSDEVEEGESLGFEEGLVGDGEEDKRKVDEEGVKGPPCSDSVKISWISFMSHVMLCFHGCCLANHGRHK